MLLDEFHSTDADGVRITPAQASRFAREIADDYNPIHDPDARRFCVPGDLLCALVLDRCGLSTRMTFTFRGMVGGNVVLRFPSEPGSAFDIADEAGKVYLHVERGGEMTRDPAMIEAFTRQYAAFSGRNFPFLLQPLLAAERVMFNPDRPLVMYDSMGFDIERLEPGTLDTEFADSSIEVRGKRADILLHFAIRIDGQVRGRGSKKLVVSGLRPYDEERMQEVIRDYEARKSAVGC